MYEFTWILHLQKKIHSNFNRFFKRKLNPPGPNLCFPPVGPSDHQTLQRDETGTTLTCTSPLQNPVTETCTGLVLNVWGGLQRAWARRPICSENFPEGSWSRRLAAVTRVLQPTDGACSGVWMRDLRQIDLQPPLGGSGPLYSAVGFRKHSGDYLLGLTTSEKVWNHRLLLLQLFGSLKRPAGCCTCCGRMFGIS